MRKLLSRCADCTVLATCRRHQNHGHFNGSIEQQLKVLHGALEGGAQAVDSESESAENCIDTLGALRSRARLIVSYHSYGGTPPLDAVMRRMLRIAADGYKIVT